MIETESMRWSCRRMAHIMENRERMEAGIRVSPRTRTSRVPFYIVRERCSSIREYFTISCFIETMLRIAVAGKNDNFVTTILQAHCSVNDQSFRAAYPKIRMKKSYILLLICFWHDCENSTRGSRKKLFAGSKASSRQNLEPRASALQNMTTS